LVPAALVAVAAHDDVEPGRPDTDAVTDSDGVSWKQMLHDGDGDPATVAVPCTAVAVAAAGVLVLVLVRVLVMAAGERDVEAGKGDFDGVAVSDEVHDVDGVADPVAVPLPDAVPLPVSLAVPEPLTVADAVIDVDPVGDGEAVTDGVPEAVGDGATPAGTTDVSSWLPHRSVALRAAYSSAAAVTVQFSVS